MSSDKVTQLQESLLATVQDDIVNLNAKNGKLKDEYPICSVRYEYTLQYIVCK